jgi:pilus assembly protein CpaB
MLPRATVAAVGPSTLVSRTTGTGEQANTEEISTAILTLALSQPDAEKLIFGQQQARLHFALLTPQSQTQPGGGVSDSNLFG